MPKSEMEKMVEKFEAKQKGVDRVRKKITTAEARLEILIRPSSRDKAVRDLEVLREDLAEREKRIERLQECLEDVRKYTAIVSRLESYKEGLGPSMAEIFEDKYGVDYHEAHSNLSHAQHRFTFFLGSYHLDV